MILMQLTPEFMYTYKYEKLELRQRRDIMAPVTRTRITVYATSTGLSLPIEFHPYFRSYSHPGLGLRNYNLNLLSADEFGPLWTR